MSCPVSFIKNIKEKKLSAEERSDGAKATHQNFLLYLFAFEVEGASNLKSRFSSSIGKKLSFLALP